VAMLICEVCGKEVKLTAPGVMVYVEAWVCTRGSGAGGGYHGISDSTELGATATRAVTSMATSAHSSTARVSSRDRAAADSRQSIQRDRWTRSRAATSRVEDRLAVRDRPLLLRCAGSTLAARQ